jgi:hypothetical protein
MLVMCTMVVKVIVIVAAAVKGGARGPGPTLVMCVQWWASSSSLPATPKRGEAGQRRFCVMLMTRVLCSLIEAMHAV